LGLFTCPLLKEAKDDKLYSLEIFLYGIYGGFPMTISNPQ